MLAGNTRLIAELWDFEDTDSMERKLIPFPEFAARRGISRQRAHQLVKMGRLEAVWIGNNLYVAEDAEIKPGKTKTGRPKEVLDK
jgi:hypothetical protein